MQKSSGGPAFPNHATFEDGEPVTGMTLRDYFAAQAVNGMLNSEYSGGPGSNLYELARQAYAVADIMLKERAK